MPEVNDAHRALGGGAGDKEPALFSRQHQAGRRLRHWDGTQDDPAGSIQTHDAVGRGTGDIQGLAIS